MDILYKLMPLTKELYLTTSKMGWALLFLFFLLGLVFIYFRTPQGSFDFVDLIKRLVIAMLLLVSFPKVSFYIQDISQGMTHSIQDISGYGAFFDMLKTRLNDILHSGWKGSLLFTNDLIISVLCYLSYLLVYISRFLMLALYQFYWSLLCVLSPIMIAFYIFRQTASVTGNLYKSLIEVSLWPFLWEIMGVMLKSLWAGNKLYVEGDYLTVLLLNLVVAIAMILTPYLVHSLFSQGLSSTAGTIGGLATAAILTAPTKIKSVSSIVRSGTNVANQSKSFLDQWNQKQVMNRIHQKYLKLPQEKTPPNKK